MDFSHIPSDVKIRAYKKNKKKRVRKTNTKNIKSVKNTKIVSPTKNTEKPTKVYVETVSGNINRRKDDEAVFRDDFDKIFIKKYKNGNFSLLTKTLNNKYKRIKIKFPSVYIPFGVERYNDKRIINFSFYGNNKNNTAYTNIFKLQTLNDKIKHIIASSEQIDTDSKEYVPFYNVSTLEFDEEMGEQYMIRCYASHTLTIIHKEYGEIDSKNIKGHSCYIDVSIGSIWVHNDKYGCMLYVDKITLH